jgi:hypothetical protein
MKRGRNREEKQLVKKLWDANERERVKQVALCGWMGCNRWFPSVAVRNEHRTWHRLVQPASERTVETTARAE